MNHGIMDLPRSFDGTLGEIRSQVGEAWHCWVYGRYIAMQQEAIRIGGTYHKAYFSGLREYPHKIWPCMVQYLQFRILEFPLNISN